MLNYFQKNDYFAAACGAQLTVCEPGHAEMILPLEPRHRTDVGRPHVHAGVLYTLAESASAAAILPYGYNCYAVEGHITYMDAVSEGTVTAVAKGKDFTPSSSITTISPGRISRINSAPTTSRPQLSEERI